MQNGIIDGISIKSHEPCIPYFRLNEQISILSTEDLVAGNQVKN